jgi:RNA polymerase sigma factor (sigma-70 family)
VNIVVTNEEFEAAWQKQDYQRLMQNACYKYNRIPVGDIEQCKCLALWKTLQDEKAGKIKFKFITYLCNRVKWECVRYILQQTKAKEISAQSNDVLYYSYDDTIPTVLDSLTLDEASLFSQRYIENMTLKEIGSKNGYCAERARQKLEAILGKLQREWS